MSKSDWIELTEEEIDHRRSVNMQKLAPREQDLLDHWSGGLDEDLLDELLVNLAKISEETLTKQHDTLANQAG